MRGNGPTPQLLRFTQHAARWIACATVFCYSIAVPDPSLLLLIPAYNEEARIEPVLREYAEFFRKNFSGSFQLVVVLNGCRDNNARRGAARGEGIPGGGLAGFSRAIGKGGALIEGLKLAGHAEVIGYVDADGATGPAAVLELLPYLEKRIA